MNASPPRVAALFNNPYGNINALASHPLDKIFATGGDDRKLRIWDFECKIEICKLDLESAITSCDFSNDGKVIAVGDARGLVRIIEIQGSRNT